MNRALPLWIFVGVATVFVVASCFTAMERSTWRLLANALMLLYMGAAGMAGAKRAAPNAWRYGIRFGLIGYGIYTLLVLALGFGIPDALTQFPFEYYDFELSGEKKLSEYVYSSDGMQETLGTALAEYGLMTAVAAIATEVGVWADRVIVHKFR